MTKLNGSWAGSMTLGVGWALLDVRIGENRPHSHIAHQISVALDGAFSVDCPQRVHFGAGDAALIPAGIVHNIGPAGARLRSLYVDSMFAGLRELEGGMEFGLIPKPQARSLAAIRSSVDVEQWVHDFLGRRNLRKIDPRLRSAVQRIEAGSSPAQLAHEARVSTTRLREIVVRDFGVPTTKLLQWLQIQHAIEAFQLSRNLAQAAAAGGFSDQAHFTRRLVEWFGVTPSSGLAQLHITVVR